MDAATPGERTRRAPRAALLLLAAVAAVVALAAVTDDVATPAPFTLFLIWPLAVLAYWARPWMLAVGLLAAALALAPVLLVGGDIYDAVLYMGTVTIVLGMTGLIAVMRRDQDALEADLRHASETDALTGLMNRRAFLPAVESRLGLALEEGTGLSVALVDIDHFKRFNDALGHLVGDEALRVVAATLAGQARSTDLVCRFGGEEFAVLADGCGDEGACALLDRVARALRVATPPDWPAVTVSAGVSSLDRAAPQSVAELIADADRALYAAKGAGRDRVACSSAAGIDVHQPVGALAADPAPAGPRRHAERQVDHVRAARGATASAAAPLEPHRAATRNRIPREVLLSRTATLLFTAGGLNLAVGTWLLDVAQPMATWQYGFSVVMLVLGAICWRLPGTERLAQASSAIGCGLIAGVLATIDPLVSPPLFLTWPIVIAAYFCTPRFVVGLTAWAGVALGGGLLVAVADVPKLVTFAETYVNLVALAVVVGWLQHRERELVRRLELAAGIDPLTGLANRRSFNVELPRQIARAGQTGRPLSLLMIDADHFKAYNDTHGHPAGDAALARIAAALRSTAGDDALLCRFGGEEFAALLPGAGQREAEAAAARLAERLAADSDERAPVVTISVGITAFAGATERAEAMVARADGALYEAKRRGRAQAVVRLPVAARVAA